MFQYFPEWVKSYALQTEQNCSQWCIFQDFVQSGVKCLNVIRIFFSFLLRNSAYYAFHMVFFSSQYSAYIFLFLLTSFYFSSTHFYLLRTLALASQSKIRQFSNSIISRKWGVELKSSQGIDSMQWAIRKECGVINKHRMYLCHQNSNHSCLAWGDHHVVWLPAQGFPLALWNTFAVFSDVKLFMLHKCEVLSGIQIIRRWP